MLHSLKNNKNDNLTKIGTALQNKKSSELVDLNKSVDFKSNIHFHKMEDLLSRTGDKLPPFRLFHYILAFFTDGSGKKTIGNFTFDIQPNLAIIVPRNIIQSTARAKQTAGYTISFHEELFHQINLPLTFLELNKLFHYSRKPYKKIDAEASKVVVKAFQDIAKLRSSSSAYDEKMLGVKLMELILLYHQLFNTDEDNNKTDYLFDRFTSLVERSFRDCRKIEWYAGELGVVPGHLNKVVQKHTGHSAKSFVQNRLFFEARYILASTKASVKEIAFDLGFEDTNYFSRQFKKFVGTSPGSYRQQQN